MLHLDESSGCIENKYFNLREFVKRLPKAELHAHLNGSFSKSTVQKLHQMKGKLPNIETNSTSRSLAQIFSAFDVIHSLTDTPQSIYTGTLDVIQDFHDDGVSYLELRSTPREVSGHMSQRSYVETVLSAINKSKHTAPGITVKLLLSINRGQSLAAAEETVKIAEAEFTSNESQIVGIDFSGNPSKGDVLKFMPILQYAKKTGLKLALHMAEIPGADNEIKELLQLEPGRIGHGTFIHPLKGGCEANFNMLQRIRAPIEVCLTSNVKSQTVASYKEHHFPLWRQIGHPCVICTDDKGIFDTNLSDEYYLAMTHYNLTADDIFDLSYQSIDYSFASNDEKAKLKKYWNERKAELFGAFSQENEKNLNQDTSA